MKEEVVAAAEAVPRAHGTQHKDVAESLRVGKDRRVRGKASQCYGNASRVIQNVPEYANADYVEGIVVNNIGLLFEHGWVEKDGVVVDPTLPEDDLIYFAGLRFKGPEGLAEALSIPKPKRTREDLPIFYRFGCGGIDSPKFRSALIASKRFLGMDDVAREYESYGSSA